MPYVCIIKREGTLIANTVLNTAGRSAHNRDANNIYQTRNTNCSMKDCRDEGKDLLRDGCRPIALYEIQSHRYNSNEQAQVFDFGGNFNAMQVHSGVNGLRCGGTQSPVVCVIYQVAKALTFKLDHFRSPKLQVHTSMSLLQLSPLSLPPINVNAYAFALYFV
ncbi:hypothetical protein K439DRAFT_1559061 [Ramaria rubella]|nr:hypothetical protein K439DRAFT_1559061 [Ramaria rubella]